MSPNIAKHEVSQLTFEDKTERHVNAAIAHDLKAYSRQRWPTGNDKFRKSRLATLLNVSARRIKSLWEGDPSAVIREHEAEAVRRLVGRIDEANRHDYENLSARIARLEATLAAVDAEFFSPQMAALREAFDGGRGGDVAGAAFEADDPEDFSD